MKRDDYPAIWRGLTQAERDMLKKIGAKRVLTVPKFPENTVTRETQDNLFDMRLIMPTHDGMDHSITQKGERVLKAGRCTR